MYYPIENVGIYVPGGLAAYPSSVIMGVVPAQLAGVKNIQIVVPPCKNGLPHPLVLGVCGLLGIENVFSVGGAQAIAALAFGTDSVDKVDKIIGPGNNFVAEAKRQVFGYVGIDSFAGASEISILHHNKDIDPEWIVNDLFAQAEHSVDTQSIFITTSEEMAFTVKNISDRILSKAKRKEYIYQAINTYGKIVHASDLEEAILAVNFCAPEHIEILCDDKEIIYRINKAGAIFFGNWTPVAVGDYMAGPNHNLPTSKTARFTSPLSVKDFMKCSSYIEYSEKKFKQNAPSIASFAKLEGLEAHAHSILSRLE